MMSGTTVGIADQLSPDQVARHTELTRGEKLNHLREMRANLEEMNRALGKNADKPTSVEAIEAAIKRVSMH